MSDVKVKFGAEDENLNATLSDVKKNLKAVDVATGDVSKGFSVGFKEIALGAAAGALAVKAAGAVMNLAMDGARAVVNRFGDALDFGGKMNDMSKSTGIAAGELTILERAFDNAGVGGEKLGTKIGKMQKFIDGATQGGKEQREAMERLGIQYTDLIGKSPTEQMQILAKGISGVVGQGDRAALTMEIFGGKTADMLPLLLNMNGELDSAKTQVGGFAQVMSRSAGNFDDLGDNLAAIKSKTMEFAAGFLEKALPALNSFVERLSGVDAAGWGAKLMEQVMKVADVLMGAFQNPQQAIELIGTALTLAAKTFGNFLYNGIVDIKDTAFPLFSAGLKTVAESFKNLLLQGVVSYIEFFAEKWLALAEMIGGPIADGAKKMIAPLMDGLKMSATEYDADMQAAHKKIADDLAKTMENTEKSTVDFFGAKPELDKLLKGTSKLEEDGEKFRKEFEKAKDLSFDMRTDFKDVVTSSQLMAGNAGLTGVALLTAGQPIKRDTDDAKKNLKEIMTIGDVLRQRDAIPPMKNFADQLKDARKDLDLIKDVIGKDLANLSVPDIAKKLGIATAGKDTKQLLVEVQAFINGIKNQEVQVGVNKDGTIKNLDQVVSNLAGFVAEAEGKPIKLGFDTKESMKIVQKDLTAQVDLAFQSSKGTNFLESIDKAVMAIRDCVKLIEPKLPQRALT